MSLSYIPLTGDWGSPPPFNNFVLYKLCVCVSVCVSHSVMPDSLQPHGLQPTSLLCPWDFPGKITGMGCHFLLWGFSWPRDQVCIVGEFFTNEPPGKSDFHNAISHFPVTRSTAKTQLLKLGSCCFGNQARTSLSFFISHYDQELGQNELPVTSKNITPIHTICLCFYHKILV